MSDQIDLVILGLSITSSWGNGHATTYRGLIRELSRRGHRITFLERNVPWYESERDLPNPNYCRTILYESVEDLKESHRELVATADMVIVGSYVPDGVEVGEWVTRMAKGTTAFYDIDTPVTLSKLARGDYEYLSPDLISRYDLYLSFTGGSTLKFLEQRYGSPSALPLYCSFDQELYFPEPREMRWDLAYMGTYSDDRQPTVSELLIKPAAHWSGGRFAVAGPQYPSDISWPENVERIEHLPPTQHRGFYNSQRFCLNVTRQDMIRAGFSPSVRLFEAAACGTPIVSDYWEGLDSIFRVGEEIFVARNGEDVMKILKKTSEADRQRVGERARERVLREHTSGHRAAQLEGYYFSRGKADRTNLSRSF